MTQQLPAIREVKERHQASLLDISGVVGIGIGERINEGGEKELCIKVYIEKQLPELAERIPKFLEGFKVESEVVGGIKLF